jgi:hypothetical protein
MSFPGKVCQISVHLFHDVDEDREEALKHSHITIARSTPLTLELVARSVSSNARANSLQCPDCQVALNLHQPDVEQPSQLLGTCECCSRWFFLVENGLDCGEMLLFELPTAETIRAAMVAPWAAHLGNLDRTSFS